jgi:signal transduction histidine kinase
VQEIIDPGLPDNFVESLFQDSRGRLWVSTPHGVAYREDGSFHAVPAVQARSVLSIAEEIDGDLWLADPNLGLFHLQDARLAEQVPWTTVGGKGVASALAGDPTRGGIWLGFLQGGLAYLKDGKIRTTYTAADGLGEGRVNRIRFDRQGTLWLATEGGLSRSKNGRMATLASKNGLPCDAAHWSVEDHDRSLWIYMACGLVHIPAAELEAWSADPNYAVKAAIFDNSDGVRSFATAGGFNPRVAQSADGKIWFEVGNGISILDPLHLPFNKLPPPVHIEQITVNRKSREVDSDSSERVRLAPLVRELQFDYTALSFVAPEKIRFRYMLEGHDSDWTEAGSRRQAFYNDLAPRKYRFRVMACNNNGVWNEAGASLEFSIAPVYYQTTAFWVSCAAAFLGLLGVLYRLRLRQVAGKLSLLYNERLGERTRIARDLHDTLLQSLAGVSLQLHGISKLAASAPEKTAPMIDNVRQQVDSAFREARLKVYNLRSPSLEGQGLAEALSEFVERMGPTATARCSFTLSGEPCACTPEVEEELLRIAQEATNNANRHAQAKEIRITLEYVENSLTLSITDDGCGFDLEEGYRKTGHWGLKNMQERAVQLRGKCKITTAAGSGTQIEVRVPLPRLPRKLRARQANSSPDN